MKKHWILMTGLAALVAICSLTAPVLAEGLIGGELDVVRTERTTTVAADDGILDGKVEQQPLQGVKLSEKALAKLEVQGRAAYEKLFSDKIPSGYRPLSDEAFEDEGDMRYTMSLMPEGWQDSTGALSSGSGYFYSLQFGNLNTDTGDAVILGLQRFKLDFSEASPEGDYSEAELAAMESAARAFAEQIGENPGKLIETCKVSGSFEVGTQMTFDAGSGTITVTVGVDGVVSGYSKIQPKG